MRLGLLYPTGMLCECEQRSGDSFGEGRQSRFGRNGSCIEDSRSDLRKHIEHDIAIDIHDIVACSKGRTAADQRVSRLEADKARAVPFDFE